MTETLDKLYLEWSNFTSAKTARDLANEVKIADLLHALAAAVDIIGHTDDEMTKHFRSVIAKAEGRDHV